MGLPSTIYTGDGHSWVDTAVPAAATAVSVYFRSNVESGVTVEGVKAADEWSFELTAEATAGMVPGEWAVQFRADLPEGPQTYRPIGRITVLQGLSFSGQASALDPRSETEIELAELRVAIRAVYRSAEYRVGSVAGGRMLKRADLPWLLERERVLLLRIAAAARDRRGVSRRVLTVFDNC